MIAIQTPAKAVLVNIPDANFRAKLQTLYPACFVGAQMETTCSGVTSAFSLDVLLLNIANLDGVQYFTNLRMLICRGNLLTVLPVLPLSLTFLDCGFNQLTSLLTLPAGLQKLYCFHNQLTTLPVLPIGLQDLECYNNQLTSLPSLPVSLILGLRCENNQLTSLPTLPVGLVRMSCFNNQLTDLPILPATLGFLSCFNNLLDFSDLEAINLSFSTIYDYNANPQTYNILPATQSVGTNTTLTINGVIGGSLNVYQWYKNNVLISGATSATYTKTNITNTDAGTYKCVVTSNYVGTGTTTGITITSSNVVVNIITCSTIAISPVNLPNGIIGTAYSQTATQTGLTGTPTWSISMGNLPSGLSIAPATGVISGTPNATIGTSNFTVSVTNGICTQTKILSIVISCPIIPITPILTTIQNYVVGIAISNITLSASGVVGATTYTYAVTSGSLPAGISLASGIISGTPTTSAVSGIFTITATASIGGCVGTAIYNYAVLCPPLLFANATAVNATVGTPYMLNAGITGNTQPTIYSISPALPAGLIFNTSTGAISGTPFTPVALTTYNVVATQGTCIATHDYVFEIYPLVKFIPTTPTTTIAIIGTPYSLNAGATTTLGTLTYTVAPALPTGLSIDTITGLISGTPTIVTGTTNYVVTARFSASYSISKTFIITINENPTTSIDNSLSNQIKVSPNPSRGDFSIDFGSIDMNKSLVRVYDAQGKTVFSSKNNTNLMTISLEKFANGIYLLEVQTEKLRIIKRLAKQ